MHTLDRLSPASKRFAFCSSLHQMAHERTLLHNFLAVARHARHTVTLVPLKSTHVWLQTVEQGWMTVTVGEDRRPLVSHTCAWPCNTGSRCTRKAPLCESGTSCCKTCHHKSKRMLAYACVAQHAIHTVGTFIDAALHSMCAHPQVFVPHQMDGMGSDYIPAYFPTHALGGDGIALIIFWVAAGILAAAAWLALSNLCLPGAVAQLPGALRACMARCGRWVPCAMCSRMSAAVFCVEVPCGQALQVVRLGGGWHVHGKLEVGGMCRAS